MAKGDIRGSKARNQVLEGQIRSLRIDLEESGLKLGLKRDELQQSMEEVKEMRLELVTVREREKKLRESSSVELHEANQTIARVIPPLALSESPNSCSQSYLLLT